MSLHEIVETAQLILYGEVDPIDGVRRLVGMAAGSPIYDSDMMRTLRRIESDTEDFPSVPRHLYPAAYLKRLDEEKQEYLKGAWPTIVSSCEGLAIQLTSQLILNGEVDPIDGVRQLVSMGRRSAAWNSDLMLTLCGIESDTEDFPTASARHLYAATYLKRLDEEKHEYLKSTWPYIVSSCEEIISHLTSGDAEEG